MLFLRAHPPPGAALLWLDVDPAGPTLAAMARPDLLTNPDAVPGAPDALRARQVRCVTTPVTHDQRRPGLAIAPAVATLRRVPSVASVGDMGDARLAAQAVTTQATTPKVWCLATGARMVVTLALTDISRGPIQAGAPRPRHATTMVMR